MDDHCYGLMDEIFFEQVVSCYLLVSFMNEFKSNIASLVFVGHSLVFFLNKPFLFKLLEGYYCRTFP
jgi:hypothetical protein